MKTGNYFIRCKKDKKPYLDLVTGYLFDTVIDGKTYKMGLHKNGFSWTVSELSTGFKVAGGKTKKLALENWDIVCRVLIGTDIFDTKIDQCITKFGIANEV